MYEIKISRQTFEEMTPWEQLEALELQVGILEDYIKDHQKKIVEAAISEAKIKDYQEQIVKYRAQIAELESWLQNK